jgi:acetyltransferase-like isoleucine patch superfamily enzyme
MLKARIGSGLSRIENYVVVSENSENICKISVGDNSVIAAGYLLIKDVPPNAVVAGNPACIFKAVA